MALLPHVSACTDVVGSELPHGLSDSADHLRLPGRPVRQR